MKAIVFEQYGSADVLQLQDLPRPAVEDGSVLVGVRAAAANPYDWHFLTGRPYLMRPILGGLLRPKFRRLGGDLAGEVEAVGAHVTRFRPGDAVFGSVNGAVPDQLLLELGSFAETVCVREDHLVAKPAHLSFEQAAAVPLAALTALNGLRDAGRVQPGHTVLINGASGGVGTFAVQLAKYFGVEVTGVCSTRNVELVRSLGADRVVDYTREDFTRSRQRYDLVFDTVGNRPLRACLRVTNPGGLYLICYGRPERRWLGPLPELLQARLLAPFVAPRMADLSWTLRTEDLLLLQKLLEERILTPVIDRTYPLSEAAEAIRHLEGGHARGKVIVTV